MDSPRPQISREVLFRPDHYLSRTELSLSDICSSADDRRGRRRGARFHVLLVPLSPGRAPCLPLKDVSSRGIPSSAGEARLPLTPTASSPPSSTISSVLSLGALGLLYSVCCVGAPQNGYGAPGAPKRRNTWSEEGGSGGRRRRGGRREVTHTAGRQTADGRRRTCSRRGTSSILDKLPRPGLNRCRSVSHT